MGNAFIKQTMETKRTVGQTLQYLRGQRGMRVKDLLTPLNIKAHTYSQIERDQRELSFFSGGQTM